MAFNARLQATMVATNSMLCVGLDPEPERLPGDVPATPPGVLRFCQAMAEATAESACAFKPQFAHFGALGAEAELATLIQWLKQRWPDLPVVLDAKRGDIGSTAARYATEAFQRHGADAVTVNPYLGEEAVEPWLGQPERGVVVLCRTSNPGSAMIQHHGSPPLFEAVARRAAEHWNRDGNVSLVCGATHPEDLGRVRALAPGLPLLVPGVGAQGGDLAATFAAGCPVPDSPGLLINASRSILYAGAGPEATLASMAAAAADAAADLASAIRRAHEHAINPSQTGT